MKIITTKYILGAMLICLAAAQANGQAEIMAKAETAIRTNNVRELTSHLNDSVELSFIDSKKSYSRVQAEFVLESFFNKYPALDFHYDHKTTSRGGLRFTIGTYTYNGGKFRVHMLIKQQDGQYFIDLIDFNQD